MIVSKYSVMGAVAATMLLTTGCGAAAGRQSTAAAPPAAEAPEAPAVTSWVTVQGDVWIPAIDALGGHLLAARAAYAASSTDRLASELAQAAARLEEEAAEADEEGRSQLRAAAADLDAAADSLEAGESLSGERLDALLDSAWEADVRSVWSTADAAVWAPFVHEPERLLELALAGFEDGNRSGAGELLRQAAALVRIEAARGETVADEEELVGVRMDLREAASEIESAELSDVSRLDAVAARAAHALARHHLLLAEHEFQIGSQETAAEALDSAVSYLERAYEWSGTPMEPHTESVLAQARAAAAASEAEGLPTAGDLEAELIAVGAEIDQLAATVEPDWLRAATS